MHNIKASREFQVFAKPTGSLCNLNCEYCYYLEKSQLYPAGQPTRMSHAVLETYIRQHINASPGSEIRFSWHGGEPTLLGIDFFETVIALQHKFQPKNQRITNSLITNGTLIDEQWAAFLSRAGFSVGISLDGPQELHDQYRVTKKQKPTFQSAFHGYELLRSHGINCDLLCVIHSENVKQPLRLHQFFKQINAPYISLLPLVNRRAESDTGASPDSITAEDFGEFLCLLFDAWKEKDMKTIQYQIFEETIRTAFGQEGALCIFRKTCGEIPVVEHNGDFYSCDHFVDAEHRIGNIQETSLADLLTDDAQIAFGRSKHAFLPQQCVECAVVEMCNGGCPKNRFIQADDGESGLNYLCKGYLRFFEHCRPFVDQLSLLWKNQNALAVPSPQTAENIGMTTPGRNAPCPCGSGKKYKKCCLRAET